MNKIFFYSNLPTIILVLFSIERIWVNMKFRNDKASSKLSAYLYAIAAFFYIFFILAPYVIAKFQNKLISEKSLFLGALIIILGVFLRNYSISSLSESWSFHLEPKEGGRLVTSGVYKYLHHPYYFSVLLELIGFSVLLESYYCLGLVLMIQTTVLLTRIHHEEYFLCSKFGELYNNYKKRTHFISI